MVSDFETRKMLKVLGESETCVGSVVIKLFALETMATVKFHDFPCGSAPCPQAMGND